MQLARIGKVLVHRRWSVSPVQFTQIFGHNGQAVPIPNIRHVCSQTSLLVEDILKKLEI